MAKKWGFGIVGCGSIADTHIAALKDIPGAKLVGVSSRGEERAAETGEREGCFWTTDYKELLARPDIDVICITTSSGSHAAIGLDAVKAGKHVIVEKPIAMTAESAWELVQAARTKGVKLAVISQSRFAEDYQAVRKAIDQNAIGRLLLAEVSLPFYRTQAYYASADWRGTVREDGGALMNQGIHPIDLLLWFGGDVTTVFGKTATQTHRMEAEDLGLAILQFKSGAFGTIMASTSFQPGFPSTLRLYGEKGTIRVQGYTIEHWTAEGMERPELAKAGDFGGAADPKAISSAYHRMQLADMIEAIEQDRDPAVTGEDGYRAVRLIETIYRSSKEGREIRL